MTPTEVVDRLHGRLCDVCPGPISDRLEGPEGQKFFRYSMVSVVAIVISEIVLLFCAGIIGWSAVVSNTVATAVATLPSYELNRKWAWGKSGRGHLMKEVIPFWVLSFIGWGFSTICVDLVEKAAKNAGYSHLVRTGLVGLTAIAAFGVLWVVKFIIFNKVLFKHGNDVPDALDGRSGLPT
jgi:putative flippase GtrA